MSSATFFNEKCPADLPFVYFMPCLILGLIWIAFASLIELRKRSSKFIPLTLVGLAYVNTLLCIFELILYSAYNMPKLLLSVLLAGIVVPTLLSALFVVVWKTRFKRDTTVQLHFSQFRSMHIYALCSIFLGDYRSWKLLYTNVSHSTKLLAFKVQLKYYNRGWSFACLISDCFLGFTGVTALTIGLENNLLLVSTIAIERLIVSCALIALTVTEWAFKTRMDPIVKA